VRQLADKTIVLDVDNVLADTAGVFCSLATLRLGRSITKEMIRSPKIIGSFRANPRVIIDMLDHVWEEWEDLPLLEGDAPSTIRELQSRGNVIIIATSRPLRSKNQVIQWLRRNKVPHDRFEHLGPYEAKSSLNADILVDDDSSQVVDFAISRDQLRHGIIFNQPWNRAMLPAVRVSRITRLSDLISF
jgi:5'(3')-deoxyribonucleotidase